MSRDTRDRKSRTATPLLRGLAVAAVAATLAAVPPSPVADDVSALRAELMQALHAAGWRSARYSVLAVSLESGDTLFSEAPADALAPASNLKLATTAAALYELGPDYRFRTYLLAHGPVENGVLKGDLVLYGTGDPGIGDRFHESRTAVFEALADSLEAAGIRSVEGDVVGDGSFFSGPLRAEGWDPRDLNDWFAAPASALSFNENVVTLRVVPGTSGTRPEVRTIPEGADLPLQNRATTVSGQRSRRIQILRESPDQPIVVEGQIRRGGREVWRQMTVSNPARYAASVFRAVLEERGVRVGGSVRAVESEEASAVTPVRLWSPASAGDGGPAVRTVAAWTSPPLTDYLEVINKKSHNLFAELTLKTLGRVESGEGTYAGGARVVRDFLAEAGVDTAGVTIVDGSGLSALNRLSASAFVGLIGHMARSSEWDAFWASLPEAGNPRELRRMYRSAAAGNLRAKTGTIENVSALSGVVRTANGERVAFSILANDVPSTWRAKRAEDRFGTRLASFQRPWEPAAPEPAGTPDTRVASADGDAPAASRGDGAGVPGTADSASARERGASARSPERVTSAEDPAGSGERSAAAATDRSPGEGEAGGEGEGAAGAPGARTHTVQRGENFTVIARRYDVTLQALRQANPDIEPRRLQPGMVLDVPGSEDEGTPAAERTDPERHRVARGENLTSIARRYGVSLNDLIDANPGIDPDRIRAGQWVNIPDDRSGV